MRSGFLNMSPSDSPVLSSDKASRNKRKFRTDQQQLPAASPLPAPLCAQHGEGSKNVYVADAYSRDSMDLQSIDGADNAAAPPTSMGCCDGVQNFIPLDIVNYKSNHHRGLVASGTIYPYSPQTTDLHTGFQYFPCPKDGQDYADLQQDPYWDGLSEGQLEEILMNMLDGVYKDAVKKIASLNFTQEEALGAVLRKGGWNKRDALTSTVESALAWLQNSEAGGSPTDLVFSDLKDMESYVLTEMICMLRKVRPYLSKGGAMWCLLMCDLNVILACTMEEDSVQLSAKEGSAPNVVLLSKQPPDLSSSNFVPNSMTTIIPSPQLTPYLPQTNAQPLNQLINSDKERHSAFSTPSFLSSPVGKVAVACHNGTSSKPPISVAARTPTTSTIMEVVSSIQKQVHESVNASNSHQLPVLEEHATKLGLYVSHTYNEQIYLEKCRDWKPDHFVARVGSLDASPSYCQDSQTTIRNIESAPQRTEGSIQISGSEQSTSFQPCFAGNNLKGHKVHCSYTVSLPSDNKQQVQTDLQIGSTSIFSGFQVPSNESWVTPNASGNVVSLTSSGAELSLATPPIVSTASTDNLGESRLDNYTDENFVNGTKSGVLSGQILGCNESNAEERKMVMLWQLVDRVKYLEAQLQGWTDWAQKRVMEATRRLTKDTMELKALRQERDEYMRLQKEKKALEESTMKKLAEMETSLSKALSQVERANTTAWRLETENKEVKAEMEAAKLTAAESVCVCQEATKREKKSIKKTLGWEKQKLKLQDELMEGKQILSSLVDQLLQARERHQQAEVRWRQEKVAKEEAQSLAVTEKQAKEAAENAAKKREETMQKKSEELTQCYRDEVQKLESEITKLRLSSGLQPSMLSWVNGYKMSPSNLDTCSAEKLKQMNARLASEIADLRQSQKDINRDQKCVRCMSEEMSVVFLPCAHQVVCSKCNDEHQKKGRRDCPFCRTPIRQRIRVFGVRP